jgi:hypothetical protein
VKLWMTDLSYITTLIKDCYGAKGPRPVIRLRCSVLIFFFS